MTAAQTDALTTRVKIAPSASRTFELVAPRDAAGKLPKAPYCVIQPSDGTATAERFTGGRTTGHPRYVLHFVGSSYAQAQTMLEQVKALFIDARGFGIPLEVEGETCTQLTWASPLPVQVDNEVNPPLIYATAEIGWSADPTI